MVFAVAALLAIVAQLLKEDQEFNVKVEQMQNILTSVGVESEKSNAQELFDKYIVNSYVISEAGSKIDGVAAFDVDLKEQVNKIDEIKTLEASLADKRVSPFKQFMSGIFTSKVIDASAIKGDIEIVKNERQLPVYVCKKDDGSTLYVIPMRGKGLWGPIWGYVALKEDLNTIYGAVYDHKGETPGLGAEIKEDWFGGAFVGKSIFTDGAFTSVEVAKAGAATSENSVDAISGGTITSKGVEAMLYDCLSSYQTYFEILKTN